MIDFTGVKYITIPEGKVAKIMRGSEVLWEKITKKYQKELAYIESTGTQWIDTKYVPSTNTKVEIKIGGVSDSSFVNTSGGWFIGSRTGSNNRGFGTYYNPSGQVLYGAFGNQQTSFSVTKTSFYNKEHTIVIDKTGLYLDGVKGLSFNNSFEGQYPLYLFTINLAGSLANLCSFKFYGLKIWQDGALVRDYIPVLDMNNAACLYDKVTEQLFYNSGTGVFKYATIEEEYREVGYIESTGTEWIDTGYDINTKTDSIYLEFEALDTTIYKWLFGEHDNNARFGIGTGDGIDKRNVAYGNNTYKVKDSQIFNGKHIFQADNTGVYIDGTKVANYSEFQSTSSLYLFNLNLSGGTYQTKARVWKYQHYRNGELIRDMYPCLSKSINRAGLFDRVSMRFFGNNGAGEFQYSGLPIEYEQVEFIKSNGNQWIDTGYAFKDDFAWEIDFEGLSVTLFGGRTSTVRTAILYQYAVGNYTSAPIAGFNGQTTPFKFADLSSGRHTLKMAVKQNKGSVWIDGVQTYNETPFSGSYISGTTQAVFADNFGDGNISEHTISKLFSLKMWQSGELVRNFIPCYRKEDGEAGLYDTVTKAFFTNQGTGNFIYPTDIEMANLMLTDSLDEEMVTMLAGTPTRMIHPDENEVVVI